MKKLLFLILSICWFNFLIAQSYDMALSRVEHAFRTRNINAIQDMVRSGITLRLEKKIYKGISSIYAMDLLNEYFRNKRNYKYFPMANGSGQLVYTKNGKQRTFNVRIILETKRHHRTFNEYYIRAINISNHNELYWDRDMRRNHY